MEIGNDLPFVLFAGPCVIENRNHALSMSRTLRDITGELGIPFVYKSSFDKANRTSGSSFRGIGFREGLDVLHEVGTSCPVMTDVHEPWQCAEVDVDVLQIPALLCRQTDLLLAAGKTGKYVNIKKGQFMSPEAMKHAAEKVGPKALLCERGTFFGYNSLVNDFRSIPIMREFAPVIFDATHSVQSPGGITTGGNREYASLLARAAVAIGVAGVFMEVHQDPDNAPSDGPNMIRLKDLKPLLQELMEFDKLAKERGYGRNSGRDRDTGRAA